MTDSIPKLKLLPKSAEVETIWPLERWGEPFSDLTQDDIKKPRIERTRKLNGEATIRFILETIDHAPSIRLAGQRLFSVQVDNSQNIYNTRVKIRQNLPTTYRGVPIKKGDNISFTEWKTERQNEDSTSELSKIANPFTVNDDEVKDILVLISD